MSKTHFFLFFFKHHIVFKQILQTNKDVYVVKWVLIIVKGVLRVWGEQLCVHAIP